MTDQIKEMPGGWHLDKRVSVGHIVTTITVAIGLAVFLLRLESRVDINSQAITYNTERINDAEQRMKDDMTDIKGSLVRIEAKLDSKADK